MLRRVKVKKCEVNLMEGFGDVLKSTRNFSHEETFNTVTFHENHLHTSYKAVLFSKKKIWENIFQKFCRSPEEIGFRI
jgi:hypothetical protein